MRYPPQHKTQPGGFYGTGIGNNMAFSDPSQMSTDVLAANIPGFGQSQGFGGPSQMSTDVIRANIPGARLAGNPSFDINKGSGALGGRSEEQIRRLQKSVPDNQQLLEEMRRRGITPGGGAKLFPMAYGGGMAPMGNAGAIAAGFQNATVY